MDLGRTILVHLRKGEDWRNSHGVLEESVESPRMVIKFEPENSRLEVVIDYLRGSEILAGRP